MGDVRSFFDSFKEFIWDIIGYLIPGAYLLILLTAVINPIYYIEFPEVFPDGMGLVFSVLAYVIGYVVYGFSDFKERILGRKSYSKTILQGVANIEAFKIAKEVLLEKYRNDNSFLQRLANMQVREIRNIAMSFIPESDQKIYTFMFRSELSRHVGNISFLIGTIGLLSVLLSRATPVYDLFRIEVQYILLYLFLILSYIFLREPRNKFYRIAITLPFNLLIAKEKNV